MSVSRLVLIGCLVITTSLLINGESRTKRDSPPKKRCGDKVVWGKEAKPGEFPMIVSINEVDKEDRDQYCAGIIINKDYILTAARCGYKNRGGKKWKKLNESEVYVVAGDFDVANDDKDQQKISVSKFIMGPDWNEKDKTGDIMLWKLSESIKLKKKVAEVAILDDEDEVPKYNDKGLFAGWGLTQKSPPKTTDKLMVGDPVYVANCDKKDQAKNVFCASRTGLLFTTTICDGDEGGPYICGTRGDKKPKICGVASHNADEKNCGKTGIFTSVGAYQEWIVKTAV